MILCITMVSIKAEVKKLPFLCLESIQRFLVDFDEKIIESAAKLKLANKLSMADCIGYSVACANQIRFLTGDK